MKPSFLETFRKENFKSWRFKTLMNWYPMYFGTGGKILFWSDDSHEIQLRLRLNPWTYNYVGTMFGGSMFSTCDPFYMLMWLKILGKNYVVWDKSASIRFKKPGKETLFAHLIISDEMIEVVKQKVKVNKEVNLPFIINWVDKDGIIYAEIERTIYIAEREFYQNKKGFNQKVRLAK
jgi:acyl-coenzyme A thioesterase PaaI-like protein